MDYADASVGWTIGNLAPWQRAFDRLTIRNMRMCWACSINGLRLAATSGKTLTETTAQAFSTIFLVEISFKVSLVRAFVF